MAYSYVGSSVKPSTVADPPDETEIVDDLSIVPLAKDSFVICEFCGRVGRREYFCKRNNKFCSVQCLTSSVRKKHRYVWKFELIEGTEHMEGLIPLEPLPQLQWHASLADLKDGPLKSSTVAIPNSYEWKDELFGCDFLAAPVSLFKHAPLHEMWDTTFEGMKVEVRNSDCVNYTEKLGDYFWVATVLKVKGYMGLLRYEGFGSDSSKDFWVNLCCSEVHPVGWCATLGKPLIPPQSIENKYTDWKKFLMKQLTDARTLPANFYNKLNDSLQSRFTVGSIMEVVDKNRISQVKVASVCEIVGKRLHVKYYDSSPEDNGFWCHEDSPLIHPVGWAFRVGHPLDAPQSYCQRVAAGRLQLSDATPEMFYKYPTNEPPLFEAGDKLEAIDPLNLSAVCAATVMQILHEGYMMIRIDCYPPDASGGDWFCYHQRSPCIFPVGFALANNIPLKPPHGFAPEEFRWEPYLALSGGRAANRASFAARGHVVSHGFVAGMRLECADLMDPRLVCVATIARVVADLLKVHFDGWGTEYDQWLWAHSTDMYPVGWCRAVGHRLEGPLQPPPKHTRKVPAKAPRRRRRQVKVMAAHPPNSTEESSQHSDLGDKSVSPPNTMSEVSNPETKHETQSNAMEHRQETGSHEMEPSHETERHEMQPMHETESHEMQPMHEMESHEMQPMHEMESREMQPMHEMESREMQPMHEMESHELKSRQEIESHEMGSRHEMGSHDIDPRQEMESHEIDPRQEMESHEMDPRQEMDSHDIESKQEIESHEMESRQEMESHEIEPRQDMERHELEPNYESGTHEIEPTHEPQWHETESQDSGPGHQPQCQDLEPIHEPQWPEQESHALEPMHEPQWPEPVRDQPEWHELENNGPESQESEGHELESHEPEWAEPVSHEESSQEQESQELQPRHEAETHETEERDEQEYGHESERHELQYGHESERQELEMEVDPPTNDAGVPSEDHARIMHVKEDVMEIPLQLPETTDDEKEMHQEEPPSQIQGFHSETASFSTITEEPCPVKRFHCETASFSTATDESPPVKQRFHCESASFSTVTEEPTPVKQRFVCETASFSTVTEEPPPVKQRFVCETASFSAVTEKTPPVKQRFHCETTSISAVTEKPPPVKQRFACEPASFSTVTDEPPPAKLRLTDATQPQPPVQRFHCEPAAFSTGVKTGTKQLQNTRRLQHAVSPFNAGISRKPPRYQARNVTDDFTTDIMDVGFPESSPENAEGSESTDKVIPKLVNNPAPFDAQRPVQPDSWTTADVAKFLSVNNCQAYRDYFAHITGPMMLRLTKDEIIELLEMKVGPSLKIFDLIQQLKCKIKQPQCRFSK